MISWEELKNTEEFKKMEEEILRIFGTKKISFGKYEENQEDFFDEDGE